MPSGLQPEIKFGMMSQQRRLSRGVDDPAGARNMTGLLRPLEAIRVSLNKILNSERGVGFTVMSFQITINQVKQGVSIHGREAYACM